MACAAANCKNKCGIGAFRGFKFPLDEDLCKQWVTNCQRTNWTPTRNSVLCEVHFEHSQFEQNSKGMKVLKWNAVPVIFTHKTPSKLRKKKKSNFEDISASESDKVIIQPSENELEPAENSFLIPINSTQIEPYVRRRICYVCEGSEGDGIRMFSFPSNPKMLSLWASACNIDADRVFPGDLLCSRHFRPEDILDRSSERKRCALKRNAVPIPVNEIMVVHDHNYVDKSDDPLGEIDENATGIQSDSFTQKLPNLLLGSEYEIAFENDRLTAIENVPCDVIIEEVQTSDTTTTTENVRCDVTIQETQTSENIPSQIIITPIRRRRFVGDFRVSDMDNQNLAKEFYEIAMQEIRKKRREVHFLQNKLQRYKVFHKELRFLKQKIRRRQKSSSKDKDSDSDYEIVTVTSEFD